MEWTNCGGIPLSGLIFVADDVQANGDRRWVCVRASGGCRALIFVDLLDHARPPRCRVRVADAPITTKPYNDGGVAQ
jgi:hypothetical protein